VSAAGASALSRPDRLWPAVTASVAAHLLFLWLGVATRTPSALEPGQQPIVARLVRLGEPRPKELLPRKEAPPPPAAEAPAPDPAPVPTAAPSPKAVAVPSTAPSAKPAPPKGPAKPGPAERAGKPGGARLSSVLSQLKQELQAGRPDGAQDGDAAEAGEGDQYLGLVVRQLRQGYRLPTTISDRERLFLTGTVVLHIEADGRISRYELTRRSGNPAFDEALERAVRETRLAPPPPQLRDLYRQTGLEVVFKI
jgi:colicin import membrane protein/protein TonB